jgi:hypothetical protein
MAETLHTNREQPINPTESLIYHLFPIKAQQNPSEHAVEIKVVHSLADGSGLP